MAILAVVVSAAACGVAGERSGGRAGVASLSPPVSASVPSSASPGASSSVAPTGSPAVAMWADGRHVESDEIVARVQRAGVRAVRLPPPPAEMLLFNAAAQDQVSVDGTRGFVIYRYRSPADARAAFGMPLVRDPYAGTIEWVARPRFVLVGDALVLFATNDEAVSSQLIAALVTP